MRTEALLGLRFWKVQRLLSLYLLRVLRLTMLEVWPLGNRDLIENGESPTSGSHVEPQRAQDQCREEVTFLKELLWGTQGRKTKDISWERVCSVARESAQRTLQSEAGIFHHSLGSGYRLFLTLVFYS